MAVKSSEAPKSLLITRILEAPRSKVFKAWTDPKHLAQWWGPEGFTNPVCDFEARRGGSIRIDMRGPDGVVYPMTGTVQEIAEPERIVFTAAALGKNGEPLLEDITTVTLEEQGGKTSQTVQARVLRVEGDGAKYVEGMEEGWKQSLNRLENYLSRI